MIDARNIFRSLPAFIVAVIWGSTFVISKSILDAGVTRFQLIFCRFVLAYIALCVMCPKPYRVEMSKTELKMFLIAVTGGSLYYFLEYSALKLSTSTNVGLICATVPIVSALISILLGLMKSTRKFALGSAVAFLGVMCVVFNGVFVFKLNPWGDFVAFLSVVSWSVYSVLLSVMPKHVTELQTTRRMFFYGTITILPILFLDDNTLPVSEVWDNLEWTHVAGIVYLGLVASGASLWLWNVSFTKIGAARTNNFLYLLPIVSAVFSSIFYSSEITLWIVIGTLLIFSGLIIANNKQTK
ncbi:MAG: DMT family transporter [Paludibacteraceae bacterium]|nr:DMT family transporter [Paludibacteraceae bacterium]